MKTLLKNALIYTPSEVINGYLAVENEMVCYIGKERPAGRFDREKDMSGKLLLPGLVNDHTHSPMTLLRGVGTDLPLQQWLFDKVFPVEARMTPEDIAAGTSLALLEMIATGTTSFRDMYFHPDVTAQLVEKSGMKANLTVPVQAFAADDSYEKNASAAEMERFFKDWNGKAEGRIKVDCCLHAEYTCFAEDVAAGTAAFCKSVGGRMHIHMSETKKEHEECIARHGKTPAGWMAEMGVFDVPCTAAHSVWVSREDMALMRQKGVTAAHNPSSNMKLGSGFAPVNEMLKTGINVSLGTDGAASNNNLDMMEELHLASIIHNGHLLDATVLPACEAITMATRNGALSQGRGDTGLLEVGCRADIIAIDLDRPHLTPCLNAVGLVTYSAQSSDVCMTMVDGKVLYENGDFLTLDREKILFEARQAVKKLYAKEG